MLDTDPDTGETTEVDCSALGRGAYSIPRSVEHLAFRTDAKFVLAIETGGMFQRLHSHRFWRTAQCVLVEMGGVPTRAIRRFVRRLSDEHDLPVYCFVETPAGQQGICVLPNGVRCDEWAFLIVAPAPSHGSSLARKSRPEEMP